MRFFGVLALAFVATVASFFATMIAIDHELFDIPGNAGARPTTAATRLAAFAAPELAATTDLLAALRPHPGLADLDGGSSREDGAAMPPSRMAQASSQTSATPLPIRSEVVPPMARRAPAEPVLVSDEPTMTAQETTAPPPLPPRKPTTVAQQAPQAKPVRRLRPAFDTATRSTLGGPKPPVATQPKSAPRVGGSDRAGPIAGR